MKFNKILLAIFAVAIMISCALFNTTKVNAEMDEKLFIQYDSTYLSYGGENKTLTFNTYGTLADTVPVNGVFKIVWTDADGNPITDEAKKPQGITYEHVSNNPSATWLLAKEQKMTLTQLKITFPEYYEVGKYYFYLTCNDQYRSNLRYAEVKGGRVEYFNTNYEDFYNLAVDHGNNETFDIICNGQYEKFKGNVIVKHPFEDQVFATIKVNYTKDAQTGGVKVTLKTSDFAELDASNFMDPEYPDEGPFGYSMEFEYDEKYFPYNTCIDLTITGEKPAPKAGVQWWIFVVIGVVLAGCATSYFVIKKKNPALFAKIFKKAVK